MIELAKQLAMERAKKAPARRRRRLGANGPILTKTMVLMVHISTVHAIVLLPDAAFPRALSTPGTPLLLDVFAVWQTSLVPSNVLLQRIGKRALPLCKREGKLPHFNGPAELPCVRMGRCQRPKNDRGAATRKLICFLGELERLCAISKCRIRIGCEYPSQVIQSGNGSRRYLQRFFVLFNRVRDFTLLNQGSSEVSVSVCVLWLYG